MDFRADIRRWPTVEDFAAHLARHDPAIAPWATGLTIHHTYIPRIEQWSGQASMVGLREFYSRKGWDSGPQLFIAHGAPNPAHDGIWQLTPVSERGIHGGACNVHRWGIEVVGNFDKAGWPAPLASLVYGAGTALLRWRNLAADVNGHRECPSTKSCPGTAINLDAVRAEFARRLAMPAPLPPLTEDAPIMAPPTCTQQQATAYLLRRGPTQYSSADVQLTIIPAYWTLCLAVGVNPAVAIAQMIHETGALSSFWCARPRRNPAGIGVDGTHSATRPADTTKWAYNPDRARWETGLSFPSWTSHAIPAHVGRLVAWATTPAQRTPAQAALVKEALSYRSLAPRLQGSAPHLAALGKLKNPMKQGWASPGLMYGVALAGTMNALRQEATP